MLHIMYKYPAPPVMKGIQLLLHLGVVLPAPLEERAQMDAGRRRANPLLPQLLAADTTGARRAGLARTESADWPGAIDIIVTVACDQML